MDNELKQKLEGLLTTNKVLLFVKGTKSFPQCGFSNAVINIFKEIGAPFETVNILADQDIRQGMKEYSSWPTFPQVYVGGEFIGGCDIVREMHQKGELAPLVAKAVKSDSNLST
ncbi:MAG: Grx4 family monothiol glutaredoxin [Polyangiales bacterium]